MTTDGHIVVQGLDVFKSSESLGIPLDIILDGLKSHGMVVDWLDFVDTALYHGWKIDSCLKRIEYTLLDVYGQSYCVIILDKLREIYT